MRGGEAARREAYRRLASARRAILSLAAIDGVRLTGSCRLVDEATGMKIEMTDWSRDGEHEHEGPVRRPAPRGQVPR